MGGVAQIGGWRLVLEGEAAEVVEGRWFRQPDTGVA
jgi:hypothetical protein